MTNPLVQPDIFKETYPHHRSVGYTLEWLNSNTIEIIWNYGFEKRTEYSIEELLGFLEPGLSINKALDKFVYDTHDLDALEVSRYGTLGFKHGLWIAASQRPDGSVKQSFFTSFSADERIKMHKTWDKELRLNNFKVTNESLIIEVSSQDESIFSTHALHSEKTLTRLLENCYDLSSNSCFLIEDNPKGNVLIGHKDAMDRLFEVPGSNYSLKTYQEIHDELWSKNVT